MEINSLGPTEPSDVPGPEKGIRDRSEAGGSRTGSNFFVSYSRVDGAFVRRLTSALRESGRDSWVDWEGTSNWCDTPINTR